jgi:hypothetical protein
MAQTSGWIDGNYGLASFAGKGGKRRGERGDADEPKKMSEGRERQRQPHGELVSAGSSGSLSSEQGARTTAAAGPFRGEKGCSLAVYLTSRRGIVPMMLCDGSCGGVWRR